MSMVDRGHEVPIIGGFRSRGSYEVDARAVVHSSPFVSHVAVRSSVMSA